MPNLPGVPSYVLAFDREPLWIVRLRQADGRLDPLA